MTTPIMPKTMSDFAEYDFVKAKGKNEDIPTLFENLSKAAIDNVDRISTNDTKMLKNGKVVGEITTEEFLEADEWLKIIDKFVGKIPEAMRKLYSDALNKLRTAAEAVGNAICEYFGSTRYSSREGLRFDKSKADGPKLVFSCESNKPREAEDAEAPRVPDSLVFGEEQKDLRDIYGTMVLRSHVRPGDKLENKISALKEFLKEYKEELNESQIAYLERELQKYEQIAADEEKAERDFISKEYDNLYAPREVAVEYNKARKDIHSHDLKEDLAVVDVSE